MFQTLVGTVAGSVPVNAPLRVVDSHTAGEPTRVIVDGGPDLGDGAMAARLRRFAEHHDGLRRTVILEPRGSDALVGALLSPPAEPDCAAGALFFNNVGYLGMCGHAAIGLAVTLAYLGRVGLGAMRLDTPVGVVTVDLTTANRVTIENVPSYRHRRDVAVDVPGMRTVRGDVAWGGNWFYLVDLESTDARVPIALAHEAELTDIAKRIKSALAAQGVTGADGAEIDHIEVLGPPVAADAHGRNFVLCPGGAYDRSPCGTGTSAKLACLAAEGVLGPGEAWIQESLIGSRFLARYRRGPQGTVIPSITGEAFVCAESTLIHQPGDPFADGIG